MAESDDSRDWTGLDAIRVLCTAIQKIHYFDKHQEGFGLPASDPVPAQSGGTLHYVDAGMQIE